jgi:hypothetical protein
VGLQDSPLRWKLRAPQEQQKSVAQQDSAELIEAQSRPAARLYPRWRASHFVVPQQATRK